MDEYYFGRRHVPAFGSWDCNNDDDLAFTQCFETARQAGLFRYSYSEERDLYVAGDLYENDIVTPAVIVVPRRRRSKGGAGGGYSDKEKEEKNQGWVMTTNDYDCELKEAKKAAAEEDTCGLPRRRVAATRARRAKKAVDEDLYKISPHILRQHAKRKRGWGLFSSCLKPTCVF